MTRPPYHREPVIEPGDWINNPSRACNGLDTEAFFPERSGSSPGEVRRAQKICSHCCVLHECRDYAVRAEPLVYGIWGGLTDGQRTRLRRERRAAA